MVVISWADTEMVVESSTVVTGHVTTGVTVKTRVTFWTLVKQTVHVS